MTALDMRLTDCRIVEEVRKCGLRQNRDFVHADQDTEATLSIAPDKIETFSKGSEPKALKNICEAELIY